MKTLAKLTYAQAAAEIALHEAEDDTHGYSQPNRQGVGTGGTGNESITLSDGTVLKIAWRDKDCSSLAIECYAAMGINTGGAWYTGDMRAKMVATGNFKVLPASTWRNPQVGDLLLNEGKHVAIAIGGGQLVEAAHSETGGISGKHGDQTGDEIRVKGLYSYPWDCVLRYCGPEREGAESAPAEKGTGESVVLMERVTGNTYKVVDVTGVNIRKGYSLDSAVTKCLEFGQERTFDGWTAVNDGWLWMRFVNDQGYYRYMAVRAAASSGQSTASDDEPSVTVSAGRWYVVTDSVRIRKAPSLSGTVTGAVLKGGSRVMDGWCTVADGYIWGRFVNGDGYYRYMAVQSSDGKTSLMHK